MTAIALRSLRLLVLGCLVALLPPLRLPAQQADPAEEPRAEASEDAQPSGAADTEHSDAEASPLPDDAEPTPEEEPEAEPAEESAGETVDEPGAEPAEEDAAEPAEAADADAAEPHDPDAAGAHDAEPAEEHDPQAEDRPAESGVAFPYHGMLIGNDGEVVEEPSDELLAQFFAATSDETDSEDGVESREAPPASLARTAYGQECSKQGVPIPPSLSSASWRSLGRLPNDRVFASRAPHTEVLFHKATESGSGNLLGICLALPRSKAGAGDSPGALELLGVICQSKRTGRACFWDNIDRTQPNQVKRLTGASYRAVDINRFQDGKALGENCTNCHRGDNVYIVHADTILAKAPEMAQTVRDPDTRYQPIGQAAWKNPAHASPPSDCAQCHGLPALTKEYCTTVLRPSIGQTMPMPFSVGQSDGRRYALEADWRTEYAADLRQIEQECAALAAP